MRCPKCHYLSFDPEPRCRNCGFNLDVEPAAEGAPLDVEIAAPPAPAGAFDDLVLRDRFKDHDPPNLTLADPNDDVTSSKTADRPRGPFDLPQAAPPTRGPRAVKPRDAAPVSSARSSRNAAAAATRRAVVAPTSELPLFLSAPSAPDTEGKHGADTEVAAEPVIVAPPAARPPMSVRAPSVDTAATPAHASTRQRGPLDRDLLEDLQRIESAEHAAAFAAASPSDDRTASAVSRLTAAAIDAIVLGAVASGVVAVTLRWCELPLARIAVLPVAPTAGFLLLIGFGYLAMFTAAGGQTLGKMAAGIRVVGDHEDVADEGASAGQVALRALLTLPSVLLAGLGFLPGLVGTRRALHDRMTQTRVVRG
jgi:uncharacterized RDD family membrane protein YckC